ncbi:MAG: transcriptional regulator [Nitrososphaerota archaeon]|nr:transcriptional regulator [Nitrososphaerota archaeon]
MSAEDLASRICNLVADGGEEGVLQSDLWKMLGLDGRGCSRIVVDLERRRIIRREKVLGGDRWTYKLMPLWRPAKVKSIEQCPCTTCPYNSRCSLTGVISPLHCPWITEWVVDEFRKKSLQEGA